MTLWVHMQARLDQGWYPQTTVWMLRSGRFPDNCWQQNQPASLESTVMQRKNVCISVCSTDHSRAWSSFWYSMPWVVPPKVTSGVARKKGFRNKIANRLVLQQFINKVNGSIDISSRHWWQFAEQLFSMEHLVSILRKILYGKLCEGISIILTLISLSCELWESWVSTCRIPNHI